MNEDFYLGAYWKNDKCTAKEYLQKSYKFLRTLGKHFEEYPDLKIVDGNLGLITIPYNEQQFLEQMLPLIADSNSWYSKPDGSRDNKITYESTSDSGFYKEYLFENKSDALTVTISAGHHEVTSPEGHSYGNDMPNNIVISFPREAINKVTNYKFASKVMKVIVDHWHPHIAYLISHEFIDKIELDEMDFYLGWLTYFEDATIVSLLPDEAKTEPLSTGLLVALSDQISSTNDTQYIERAKKIRDSLNQHKKLCWTEGSTSI